MASVPQNSTVLWGQFAGFFNYFDAANNHFFGINKAPATGITLDLHGALQLGETGDDCKPNFAGSLQFTGGHFVFCNGQTGDR